ncbi:MAG TPA: Xaa-Pro aminopeptidase [Vicinamibacteria bacterium]|nr:Xaa-Pro aminopeptidase [Vicinamibacteria bacterium]
MRRLALPLCAQLWTLPLAAGELQDDLAARRSRLLSALGPEVLFIQTSAPERVYSRDVEYEYRPDSDLLYLTGIGQPKTLLLLMPGNRTKREILFVRDPDPVQEHRVGHLLSKEEARAASGIADVQYLSELDDFLKRLANRRAPGPRWAEPDGEYEAFFDAMKAGRARLALVLGQRPGPDEELTEALALAEKLRLRFVGATLQDATDLVHGLRQVKTPYERRVLQTSTDISSEAHRAAMRAGRAGRWEYEIEAALEEVYLRKGAMSWGYPSIVGSGPNATILHYGESKRQTRDGDLVLVDAAANYQGLTADITRTWPVSGRFSPEQADIYRLVLAAQEAGIKAARAGQRTADIEKAVAEVARAGLKRLGLVTDAASEQFRTWYTHGVCHFIGMDVHDVGDYRRPLEPGMAFVIEPGIYVREQALEHLPDTPEMKAFAEAVRPAVRKYKDIGVRVEDSFLLTDEGLVRLSAAAPRTLEDVEAFLQQR